MDSLLSVIEGINSSTASLTDVIDIAQGSLWTYFLFYALIAAGLYITIRTRGIQWRGLPEMFRTLTDPAGTERNGEKSISAFRAFTVSAASRVGTGNIAGVAVAIAMGGPGAVFWMWVVATVGSASAFAESLLGQLYKERGKDSYIGGPAYYMKRGLKARWLGLIFVAFIVITYGFVFCAVQTNAIVEATANSFNIGVTGTNGMDFRILVGLVVVALTAAIIFGGIRTISSVTGWLVPVMAVLYILLGLLVIGLNITKVPEMLLMIFQGALGIKEFVTGGAIGAIVWGMKRGLLSNEAGMGTAPNAGATATVSHPAKQGYVQTLGVYFDTMIVCTVTAFIVLLSNPVYGDKSRGAGLTQDALASQLGTWAVHFLTIAIFLFAFSSVIGNYYYAESNIRFVTERTWALVALRVLVLAFVFFGAIASLDLVWTLADLLNGGMVIVNLIAVLAMTGTVVKVLKNYEDQRKNGLEPIFQASDMPEIENLAAWDGTDDVTTREFWAERDAAAAQRKAKAAR
ncbi:MAG: alanine/glycine:cation symporter family protein [Rothia sp. (in: high G+C Gram-positive bacteria)]|uniref:alanine/glycine:cation symporter family protein n=1 Tax=Rothia sp. (in: high G+C Gram-positive bacteria) TaxID=1885016 RepID=UPI0026DF39B9|nr:alanine/glycine:cation symporter family protein [Rothia sp. (in: high G+C Gram-positive bacteria)]MDO5750437.1 alanine/glycine:cation symporter family protein [Rothia sp. (in: high G+C Gram-positive bacteria)]